MKRAFALYAAGSFGALVVLAIRFALEGNAPWALPPRSGGFYAGLVWGGAWAWTSLFPGFSKLSPLQLGLVIALFPCAAQLLYFYPRAGWGWLGLGLGVLTPFLSFAQAVLWGWTTAYTASRI